MTRRSQKEMEQDCLRIKEAAKTATCMKDLESMTGLSARQINSSLTKHPIIFKRIKEQLATNKANAEALVQKEKELEAKAMALATQKEAELKTKRSANAVAQTKNTSTTSDEQCIEFVIDASITGYKGLEDVLAQIRATKAKITLTSITIEELDRLQKYNDVQALDARHILALASKEPENFKLVAINYSNPLPMLHLSHIEPDDHIIQYCVDNKDRVTLLTSDKKMTLKARMCGVQTEYLVLPSYSSKITEVTTSETPKSEVVTSYEPKKVIQSFTASQKTESDKVLPNSFSRFPIRTLPYAQYFGNKLTFSCFHTKKMSARVFADGREYNSGMVNLKVGDDIYIATKETKGILFSHYKMSSISSENNCRVVFSTLISLHSQMSRITNKRYATFLRDCMLRFDL